MTDFLEKKGILPGLMGGLGNQMFIVAASFVAAEVHQCPFYLPKNPVQNNKHNHLHLDYNQSIFKEIGEHLDISLGHALGLAYQGGYHDVHWSAFGAWNPQTVPVGSILRSYCQYYPTLAPFADTLRNRFRAGLDPYIQSAQRLYNPQRAAFLHIRRGDYLNHPDIHYQQPLAYYKFCVETLVADVGPKQIWVVSDDPEWVKAQPYFCENPLFHICESKNELECIALMTLCDLGAICANSTFSWWGAFLGCGPTGKVFVPQRWISEHVEALFPEDWRIVSATDYL